jgi:hypothetical protein
MVTYRRTPTVLVLLAVAVALFAVASGMVIPTDSFQQVNESDSLSGMVTPTDSFQQVNESDSSELEWSLVTGVYTLFEYTVSLTLFICIHAMYFSVYTCNHIQCIHVITFSNFHLLKQSYT